MLFFFQVPWEMRGKVFMLILVIYKNILMQIYYMRNISYRKICIVIYVVITVGVCGGGGLRCAGQRSTARQHLPATRRCTGLRGPRPHHSPGSRPFIPWWAWRKSLMSNSRVWVFSHRDKISHSFYRLTSLWEYMVTHIIQQLQRRRIHNCNNI